MYKVFGPILLLTVSCGITNDSETNMGGGGADFPKVKPQGFMIADMEVKSADDECPSEFGARLNFVPRDKSKSPVALVECYNYKRVQPEADPKKVYQSRAPDENETAGWDYSSESLSDFCTANDLQELGADIITPENTSANRKGPLFSCPRAGDFDEITELSIRNDPFDKAVFDMRTLKYFKNLKELHLRTNAISASDPFLSPKGLKMLYLNITGGDSDRRKEMLENIAKGLTEVEFVEVIFHDLYDGREALNAKFLSLMPNLRAVASTIGFKNLKSLNGHKNLEMIELPYSEDSIDVSTMPKLQSIRYEADQGSNINWSDRKLFHIHQQVFTEYK